VSEVQTPAPAYNNALSCQLSYAQRTVFDVFYQFEQTNIFFEKKSAKKNTQQYIIRLIKCQLKLCKNIIHKKNLKLHNLVKIQVAIATNTTSKS